MHQTWWRDVVSEVLNGMVAVVICLLYSQLKSITATRPDWCTMSWMPAKMSPLQPSQVSDGAFSPWWVEATVSSQGEKEGGIFIY